MACSAIGGAGDSAVSGHRAYNDEQGAQAALVENLCREALNPLEAAQAIQKLIDEFDYTHEETALILGLDRTGVTHLLRLLGLDGRIQAWIRDNRLTASHGKALAGVAPLKQYPLAEKCLNQGWPIRRLEAEIKRTSVKKAAPGIDIDNAYLERHLSDQLGCPARVKKRPRNGYQLTLDFVDAGQMQAILKKLDYHS